MKKLRYLVVCMGQIKLNGKPVGLGIPGCIATAPIFDNEPDAYAWAEQNRQPNGSVPEIVELEYTD